MYGFNAEFCKQNSALFCLLRRPWQVQKLTSLSIFEREFLLCKNIATAWNHRPPWRIGAGFIYHSCSTFQFLIVRVASSNPAPMSTIFFPSTRYFSA